MLRLILSCLSLLLILGGCVNKRGISARYYNGCEEYYDYQGYYHKDCDDNLLEFE